MNYRANRTVLAWPARRNREDNPFQWLLSTALEDNGWEVLEFSIPNLLRRPGAVWHWHWTESQLAHRRGPAAWVRLCVLELLMRIANLSRSPIVLTVHNLAPHDRAPSRASARLINSLDRHVSGYHYLSESSMNATHDARPKARRSPGVVTRHGHYLDVIGQRPSMAEARARLRLGIEDDVFAFAGKIRPYKGVFDLVDAFSQISQGSARQLVLAGQPESDELRISLRKIGELPGRTVIDRHLSQSEIVSVIVAADLVVLPYRNVLNSGSALFALSVGTPILVPAVGPMLELQDSVGEDWVRTFSGPLSPEILLRSLGPAPSAQSRPDLSAFGWADVASALSEFYRELR